eukprot:5594621-Prymnesium_polylepis.1
MTREKGWHHPTVSWLRKLVADDTTGTQEGRCPIGTGRHASLDQRVGHTNSAHASKMVTHTDRRALHPRTQ